jgi:CRP-like cAMP-binding protein
LSDGERTRRGGARDADFPRALRDAIGAGALSEVPEPALKRFLDAGVRLSLARRTVHVAEGEASQPALIVDGLIRANIGAPDGRQVTVSYMRPGDLLGFVGLFGAALSTTIETVTDARLLVFAPAEVSRQIASDVESARLFARVVARRLTVVVEELTLHVFGTVRERVCHHLLDLAMGSDPRGPLFAEVTQQQLADATGAARESVARALRDLEAEGLIERTGRRVTLLLPLLMHPAHRHWLEHRLAVS